MSATETARTIYANVLQPLLPNDGRLRRLSYLDFPLREEFDREIRTWIHLSNGVIAILDTVIPNVIYEIGVAVGFGKPVVLLAPDVQQIPEMLRARNVVVFQRDDPGNEQVRIKLDRILTATLHGTFNDKRFQDHAALLINNPELSDSPENELPQNGSGVIEPDDLELGISAYNAKNYPEAATHLQLAMETGNRDPDTYFYLADTYFFLGESLNPGERQRRNYQKMHHFAREGTRFHSNDKRLRKTLGLSCMKLGDFDRAEKLFTELFNEDPEFIEAAYNLACLHALQRKRTHCIRFLTEVFIKNPAFRYLARLDSDFDNVWEDELLQRIMFPCPINL